MPVGFAGRWLSLKALGYHLALLVLVPAFLTAAWWQADRAAAGNTLSYLYMIEWPAFACVAVWAWWQLIHLPPRPAGDAGDATASWLHWDPADESPQLRAYNHYLAELNRTGRMTKPPGLGWRRRPELSSPARKPVTAHGAIALPPGATANPEDGVTPHDSAPPPDNDTPPEVATRPRPVRSRAFDAARRLAMTLR